MKDAAEFVQSLTVLANPWTVGIALLLAAPVVYKVLLEIASVSHSTREKKLVVLLKYIDAGIDKCPRFSVEQAFQQKYGVLVDYDLIERLMTSIAASTHVQNYIWGRSFLRFDRQSSGFVFNKDYNWKTRGSSLLVLFGMSYAIAAISFVGGIALLSMGAWDGALKAFSLFGVMAAGVVVAVLAARASRAARDVVEEQRNTVPTRTNDDGTG